MLRAVLADHAAHGACGGGGLPRARAGPPGRGARSRRAGRPRGAARAAAQRHHRHGPRAVGAGDAAGPGVDGRAARRRRPPSWPSGSTPARCRRCCSASWPRSSPSTAHRTAAEIDLGMPRWSDDPTQVLGSLANYLRITDPADHPDARFARAAAAAEAAVARGRRARCGGARGSARWSLASPCAARASSPGMRETHKDYLVRGARPRPRPSSRSSARSWPAAVCSRRGGRRLLPGAARGRGRARRRRPARRRSPTAAPSTTGSCAAATSRACCSRTAPSRRPSTPHRAPEGALVGIRGVGGHRHGRRAGGARPGRRPPGAGRDPRRPLDRPRLDPAVPHRGRPGHGDGRGKLARGGGRTGVRHPGGRRRARRREPACAPARP